MEMDDTEDAASVVYYDNAGDAALLHKGQSLAREDTWLDCLWRGIEALRGGHAERGAAVLFHNAAKVAISENSGKRAVGVQDCGHTEFFRGHFMEDVGHWRLRRNFGKRVTRVHDFVHAEEAFTEAACRVKRGEIVMAKIAAFEQRNGKRVADGH